MVYDDNNFHRLQNKGHDRFKDNEERTIVHG